MFNLYIGFMKRFFITILTSILFIATYAQTNNNFIKDKFIAKGDTLPLRILYPQNFDATKKYPVILFLHGSGERGNDNKKQLVHGGKMFLEDNFRENYPAVVIFPQCANDSYWANVKIFSNEKSNEKFDFKTSGRPTKAMQLLTKYVNELQKLSYLDEDRFYIGGLSMGGMGTYELLRRETKTFAAAFIICGGDNINNVKKYYKVPLWIFHGEKDDVVNSQYANDIAKELEKRNAAYKLTIYPNTNHNSWDMAFAEKDLMPWLFSHKKD